MGARARVAAMAVLVVLPACSVSPGPAAVASRPATTRPASAAPLDGPPASAVPAPPSPGATAGGATAAPAGALGDGAAAVPQPPAAPPLPEGVHRPAWLGTRPLEVGPDGEALPAPTPPELVVRRVPTIDLLPPPPAGAPFASTVEPVPDDVLARSTWTPACPVAREDLAHLTLSFWGFDERSHTGELIVHADWAAEVVEIFRQLFDARYPIEEMRIVSAAELEGTPTGDGNVTSGFVCRPTRGSSSWSQHAFGLAVDVNPFQNPYHRGERILPELAGAYLDRGHDRPGMLHEGSTAVQAFDAIGWGWGGRWQSLTDPMHFSANGR